jgi:hypothetical protein
LLGYALKLKLTVPISSSAAVAAVAVRAAATVFPDMGQSAVPYRPPDRMPRKLIASVRRHTFEKPGLLEKDLVIEVVGQEGNRFWGNQTIMGNGERTEEPMIGELTGENNKTVVIVDKDGYINGRLIGNDTLSFCYMQAGGKPSPALSVAPRSNERTEQPSYCRVAPKSRYKRSFRASSDIVRCRK